MCVCVLFHFVDSHKIVCKSMYCNHGCLFVCLGHLVVHGYNVNSGECEVPKWMLVPKWTIIPMSEMH